LKTWLLKIWYSLNVGLLFFSRALANSILVILGGECVSSQTVMPEHEVLSSFKLFALKEEKDGSQ
jgi:hypothetical protein